MDSKYVILENFWKHKPDTFHCFQHCNTRHEQNLSLLLPTPELRCHHLTLLFTHSQTSSIWHEIPDKCHWEVTAFPLRNCYKCLFVSKPPVLPCLKSPLPLTNLRTKQEEPPSNGDSLQMKIKVTKSRGKKLQKQGMSRGAGKRTPWHPPMARAEPHPCRDAAPCWTLTAPPREVRKPHRMN